MTDRKYDIICKSSVSFS